MLLNSHARLEKQFNGRNESCVIPERQDSSHQKPTSESLPFRSFKERQLFLCVHLELPRYSRCLVANPKQKIGFENQKHVLDQEASSVVNRKSEIVLLLPQCSSIIFDNFGSCEL